jgi:hypothetical protein
MPKSDWPRAAAERAGGARTIFAKNNFVRINLGAMGSHLTVHGSTSSGRTVGGQATILLRATAITFTLTLSRAGREETALRVHHLHDSALYSQQPVIDVCVGDIERRCEAQDIVVAGG